MGHRPFSRCAAGRIILAGTMLLAFPGCKGHQRPRAAIEVPEALATIPDDFKPVYWVVGEDDYGYKRKTGRMKSDKVHRIMVRMTVPPDLGRSELENSIKHVMRATYLKSEAESMMVFVYHQGDDTSGPFTVARGEWATGRLSMEFRPSGSVAGQDSSAE